MFVSAYEQIMLDEFCVLVVQHNQNLSLLSSVKLMIFSYFCTSASVRPTDIGVFAIDMADIGLQFHKPDPYPILVMFLPVVLKKFAIIESRAEQPLWHAASGLWHQRDS